MEAESTVQFMLNGSIEQQRRIKERGGTLIEHRRPATDTVAAGVARTCGRIIDITRYIFDSLYDSKSRNCIHQKYLITRSPATPPQSAAEQVAVT